MNVRNGLEHTEGKRKDSRIRTGTKNNFKTSDGVVEKVEYLFFFFFLQKDVVNEDGRM